MLKIVLTCPGPHLQKTSGRCRFDLNVGVHFAKHDLCHTMEKPLGKEEIVQELKGIYENLYQAFREWRLMTQNKENNSVTF